MLFRRGFACASLLGLLLTSGAFAQDAPPKPGPQHEVLAEMAGEWSVSFSAGGATFDGQSVNKKAHGGQWLISELTAKMPGVEFTGTGLDGYDSGKKKFVSVWVDSMIQSPILFEGELSADGKTIAYTGKGPGPSGAETAYKSSIEMQSKDKHVFKLWAGDLAGEPMMTATYTRKK